MSQIIVIAPSGAQHELPSALTLLVHSVDVVENCPTTFHADIDLVVVDARFDAMAGRDASISARSRSDLPILLIIDPSSLAIVQRTWGADDFILAETTPAEMEARIRQLVANTKSASLITTGAIVIDEDAYTAHAGGRSLELTYTEFELLKYLASHPGRVLTREHLLSQVWGYDYYGGTRTVDVHIRRLRAKLGPEHEGHVTTVRNVGYRFQATK